MLKEIVIILIVILFIVIFLSYLKARILYKPEECDPVKYDRFFDKLNHLAGTDNEIITQFISTNDNIMIDTTCIKNNDSKKLAIFFHGNAGNMSMRFDMIKFLHNYSSVLIFDYRSYGRSSGYISDLSSKTLLLDAKAVWNYAIDGLEYQPNDIVFFGESLGCAVSIQLACELSKTDYVPQALILNCPFRSLSSMINHYLEQLRLGWASGLISTIFGQEYSSDKIIKTLNPNIEVVIAHCIRDEIIPYYQGCELFRILYDTHPDSKFLSIRGTHNSLVLTESYVYTLAQIFEDKKLIH